MKIGLVQFDPTIGAFAENVARMQEFATQARAAGCELVVFPELAICGYPARDLLEREEFIQDNLYALDALISDVRGIAVLCGYVARNTSGVGPPICNSAVLFEDGKVIGRVDKRLLPAYDVFDETRYFAPGDKNEPVVYRGIQLGITICEDIWSDTEFFPANLYLSDPVAELIERGAELFVTISASPFDLGKPSFRRRIVKHLAGKYQKVFLYLNQVGGQDSLIFDGNSFVVDATGKMVAHAVDFAEDVIVFDTEANRGDVRATSMSDEEALVKAIALGLRDYMARCGFEKCVLGLSGGVDSSVTATIAAKALGPEHVLGVLMPSAYTSQESIEDAKELARDLEIEVRTIPISRILDVYLKELAPFFPGKDSDVTEQNLQARIRANILMAISNKFGHLVLSTGNKSELAVGYCTLYGDLTGGYALISDVPKTMVYRVARYLNHEVALIPERVLTKAPSAELRPNQRDQDDLPPYELLDQIIVRYLEDTASPEAIVGDGFDREVVLEVIGMVDRSEYKRRQAPFGPRVTSRAFGCGRRYPVAHRYRR